MAGLADVRPGDKNKITDTTLLGTKFQFEDLNYAAAGPVLTKYSGEMSTAILVINRSNGTLAAGKRVTWEVSGEEGPGRAVAALGGDDLEANGIVDPWITGTIADNETFLLFVEGPTKVCYDGAATIVVGSKLGGDTSGDVDVYVDGTDQVIAYCGVALEAKSSGSSGDLFRARVHFPR